MLAKEERRRVAGERLELGSWSLPSSALQALSKGTSLAQCCKAGRHNPAPACVRSGGVSWAMSLWSLLVYDFMLHLPEEDVRTKCA